MRASEPRFRAFVSRGLFITADGRPCADQLQGGGDVEGDGFGLSVLYACPSLSRSLTIRYALLGELPVGHRHFANVTALGAHIEKTLSIDEDTLTLRGTSSAPSNSLTSAVLLGVQHILTGWDHLLFLAALLLGLSRLRPMIVAITAFTIAHSLTLATSALGLFAPSPRFIEPAIAASIAYVAFENMLRSGNVSHRWRITFAFGLIHGFGFASTLRALALTSERLLPTLFGFNLGVELGQLAACGLLLPLLLVLRRLLKDRFDWVRWSSLALGLVGLGVCAARIAGV